MKPLSDAQWAHALARLGMGINIALHGWTRLPKLDEFATSLQQQFAATILPAAWVKLSAYAIAGAESVIGTLLLLGWCLRPTLIAGHLLMCVLLFGTCLTQNWNAAGTQMVYLGFFALLLGFRRYSALSIDPRPADAP
ncbi:MAG TPA: DoxX family membrane protein [Opitutaceae bacterium]|nr:DoxX family membrane protein [Opitutaceae bacterium]